VQRRGFLATNDHFSSSWTFRVVWGKRRLQGKSDLAILYQRQGKYDQSEPLYRAAADGARTRLGLANPRTQSYIGDLIACLEQSGKHADAESLRRELADFWKQKDGAESPRYVSEVLGLCQNLRQQQKHAEAEPLMRACLTIRQRVEPDAWTTFETQALLGQSLRAQKKYAEAEQLSLAGYHGMKQRERKVPANSKARLGRF
jgi:hypothetical protein